MVRGRTRRSRLRWPAVVVLLALALGASFAVAAPDGLVRVASGTRSGVDWRVSVGVSHGSRCYSIETGLEKLLGGETSCAAGGGEMIGEWQRIIGSGEPGSTSVELDLTSRRVHTLRLVVHRTGDGKRRRIFHPRTLSRAESAASGLPRDFRYVVIVEPSEFCVEGVEAVDLGGHVLLNERVPCER